MRRFSGIAVIGLGLAGVFILVGVLPSGGSDEGQSGSAVQAASAATSSAAAVESRRVAGANRFETAAMVARERMPVDASELYVATGVNFPDALAAGAAGGAKAAPVVLTADAVPDATRAEIDRIDPSDVYVAGGSGAVSEQAAQQIDGLTGAAVHRLAGSERMATAAALAEDAFSAPVPVAYVATGGEFADALAGGAAAAVEDGPLLLTAGDHVPGPTQSALSQLQPERIVVLGGTAAVSESVADDLASFTDGSVERRAGSNRFVTAAQVSQSTFDGAGTVYLATGEDFPDALAGAPAAAVDGAPLLLVGHGLLPNEAEAELERLAPCTVVTLGGAAAISEDVEDDAVAAAQRGADEQGGCTGDAGADDDRPGQDRQPAASCDEVHHVVTGDQPDGFTVPAGECWQIEGEVTTSENVVVLGGLKMRSGSTLTFVDVDEAAFVGGGIDEVFDTDVGLWVMGSGVLDIQGTEKQGWNRSGEHLSWDPEDEYVRAPSGGEDGPQSWSFGDEVPCEEFAGEEYCAEVANLTRDVRIAGTEDGQSHIFINSDSPQTIRYVELQFMGPNGDSDELLAGHTDPPVGRCCPDGRYGIHFHHSGDGSRGSVVEGIVARDSGDHVFAPHESHGITLRDNVAYNVLNTPYWWDPGDESHDITYERNLALGVGPNRETTTSLAGYRMAKGEGVVAVGNVAAAVSGGRGSSGYLWNDGSPNKWVFRDNVAHHTNNGVWHWRNEGREPFEPHRQEGFVAYRTGRYPIEQGAYEGYSHWTDSVIFGQGSEGIRHRHAPNKYGLDVRGGTDADARESTHPEHDETTHDDLVPGSRYVGGTVQGGANEGHGYAIAVEARRHCEGPEDIGQHTLFEDLHLLPRSGYEAVKINQDHESCARDDGRFHLVFRDVVVGDDRRDLEPEDFDIRAWPSESVIRVERTDGDTFTLEN